jgi:type II secretory pathway pseudopilin PulG
VSKIGNREFKASYGFTLVEVCIVIIISGLLFVSLFELYSRYMQQRSADITYENQQKVAVEISTFRSKKQRYPCPSDRTLAVNDPNFGKEIDPTANLSCNVASIGLTPGNCYSAGSGITPAGTNGVGGVCMFLNGVGNAVLIGGVPIAALRAVNGQSNSREIAFDGWGSQFDYVVTYQLTSKATYRYDRGGITVHDENGNNTAGIVDNGHYGIISHGKDQIGAFTRYGRMISICGTHVPQSYNTGDDQNCSNNSTFIQGIRNNTQTALHYDDLTYFVIVSSGGLWAQMPGSSDMSNVNPGMVNVGTDGIASPPPASVALNVDDPLGGTAGVVRAATNTKTNSLCARTGTDCFDIKAITNATGVGQKITCTGGQVMTGITTDGAGTHATCATPTFKTPATITAQTCLSGKWMMGIATDGTIICQP